MRRRGGPPSNSALSSFRRSAIRGAYRGRSRGETIRHTRPPRSRAAFVLPRPLIGDPRRRVSIESEGYSWPRRVRPIPFLVKPLTRADREFLLLAGSFSAYGLVALVSSVAFERHVALALAAAVASAPIFALASAALTPAQTTHFLERAADAPPSAPRESRGGQLARFLLASLVLALPLAGGSVVGLVLLFDRLSPPFGAVVEGLAAGVFLGFGFGYLRLSSWMRRWQVQARKLVWREAWPRRRSKNVDASARRTRSPLVRYYLTPPDSHSPA